MGDRHQPQGDQSADGGAQCSVVLRLPLGWRIAYALLFIMMVAVLGVALVIARETARIGAEVGHGAGPGAAVMCPGIGLLMFVAIGVCLPCLPIRSSVEAGALRIRGILGPGPKTIPLTSIRWVRRVDSYTLDWPTLVLDKSQWVVGAREWAYSARAHLPFPVPLLPHTYRKGVVLGLGEQGTLFIEMPDPGAFVGALGSRGVRVLAGQPAQ